MNTESFSYVIITAVLGMSVVFLFLWFLSVLMTVIKLAFGEKPQKNEALEGVQRTPGADTAKAPSTAEEKDDIPQWVLAAVATYVMEEELSARRSAESWTPRAEDNQTPWVAIPRY